MSSEPEGYVAMQSRRWMSWILASVLVASALGFLVLAMIMPFRSGDSITPPRLSWFLAFVLLPGITGLANFIVTARQRDAESVTYEEMRHRPKLREALAAAILLTGVFGVVANARAMSDPKLDGLVYAGYGASLLSKIAEDWGVRGAE